MAGYFQKTTTAGQGVPRIKYSADYASLQAAIDDTATGETLFVNADYTLTATAEITSRGVVIDSNRATIRPTSNGSPSPLLRVKNSATTTLVNGVTIRGLRFENLTVGVGSGLGNALEITDALPVGAANAVYHIRCDDLEVLNFARGINLVNAFDIIICNSDVEECQIGIRAETTLSGKFAGQLKLMTNLLQKNEYHVSTNNVTGGIVGDVELFGVLIGHRRTGVSGHGSTGIFMGGDCGGVFVFGSHLEDLANGVYGQSGFTTSVGMFGSKMILSSTFGNAGFDFTTGTVGSVSIVGVAFSANSGIPLYKIPSTLHGVLVGGNIQSGIGTAPNNGLIETVVTGGKSAY